MSAMRWRRLVAFMSESVHMFRQIRWTQGSDVELTAAYFNHQTNTGFTWDRSDFGRAISLVTLETSTVAACQIISKRDDVTEAATVPERRRSNGELASGRNATVSLSH
jgi:hypothetical protein